MHMYFEATALLYILTVFTLAVFLVGVYANIYLWREGKAPSLRHRMLTGPILKALILDALLQAQLLRQSAVRWFMHICIFWGFLGLLAHTTLLAVMSHFVPADTALSQYIFLGPGKPFLDVWGDLWGLILLIGLVIAFVRRYVVKAVQLDTILMDNAALIFLFAIALTGFLSEAQRLAAAPYDPSMRYSFVGVVLASVLRSAPSLIFDYISVVWVHTLISLVFLSLIPFSKTWHAFVSPVEIALDHHFYRQLIAAVSELSKTDRAVAQRLVGVQIDMENISWLIRFKSFYHMSLQEVLEYSIPAGVNLNRELIASAYEAEHSSDVLSALVRRRYPELAAMVTAGQAGQPGGREQRQRPDALGVAAGELHGGPAAQGHPRDPNPLLPDGVEQLLQPVRRLPARQGERGALAQPGMPGDVGGDHPELAAPHGDVPQERRRVGRRTVEEQQRVAVPGAGFDQDIGHRIAHAQIGRHGAVEYAAANGEHVGRRAAHIDHDKLAERLRVLLCVAPPEREPPAALGDAARHSQADPAVAARDQRHPPGGHRRPSASASRTAPGSPRRRSSRCPPGGGSGWWPGRPPRPAGLGPWRWRIRAARPGRGRRSRPRTPARETPWPR